MSSATTGFRDTFGADGEFQIFSPGRVNLIGEHIDYCGGLVLPMAIDRGTFCVGARNADNRFRLYSTRFEESVELDSRELPDRAIGHWSDYAIGVARTLDLTSQPGLDLWIDDNIGAGGLSSSASFSVAVALALTYGRQGADAMDDAGRLLMARQCQRAENEFVGVACGVMDQVSVLLGGTILLDCANLDVQHVETDFGDHRLVIMDTGKERTLAASAYNQRVVEVSRILSMLPRFDIENLCDLPADRLITAIDALDDEVLQRRLRHVVTEQARVMDARKALRSGDMLAFGELLTASHVSLRDDYEVTGPELDTIVDLGRHQPGVLGARMTGAGFGGCAIALVRHDCLEDFEGNVIEGYRKETGLTCRIFPVSQSAGAQFL